MQVRSFQQAQVSGDDVARFNDHDVAWHEFKRIDISDLAAAANPGSHPRDTPQRFHRSHRAELGEKADGGIDDDYGDNREPLGSIADVE